MMRADIVNGLYETAGSIAIWFNVRKLYQDKIVKGILWKPFIFWSSWSVWNCYYYPHLHQWFSFAGGASLCIANIVWTSMAAYYMRPKKSKLPPLQLDAPVNPSEVLNGDFQ